MKSVLLYNGLVVADQMIKQGAVGIVDGRIAFLGSMDDVPTSFPGGEKIDVQGSWIFPGLIDVHMHGGAGYDFMDGEADSLETIAVHLAQYGVAGFLPSTVTASKEKTRQAATIVAEADVSQGAEVLGIHLEGPYINEARKGAQFADAIRQADLKELAELHAILGEKLKLVTLAPEVPGGLQAVDWLADQGITAAVGHSDASYEQTVEGFGRGISHVTHTFNGMRGLHHRDPGVVGATMAQQGIFAEIIADGVHVHPGAIQALLRAKGPEWIVLVTDAVQAQGLPDGEYALGDQPIFVKNGEARLAAGNLAGSTLNMMLAVQNMVEWGLASVKEAVQMASLNPAKTLGLTRRGWIREGFRGDVVVVSPEWQVQRNYIQGKLAFSRER